MVSLIAGTLEMGGLNDRSQEISFCHASLWPVLVEMKRKRKKKWV